MFTDVVNNNGWERKEIGRKSNGGEEKETLRRKKKENIKAHQSATSAYTGETENEMEAFSSTKKEKDDDENFPK